MGDKIKIQYKKKKKKRKQIENKTSFLKTDQQQNMK